MFLAFLIQKLLKKVFNRYMMLLTHGLQIRFDSQFPTL